MAVAPEPAYDSVERRAYGRAQEVKELTFPAHAQEHWVSSQGYAERPWSELIDLWRLYNRHLAHVISLIPGERLAAICVIGMNEPVSLGYLIEDYLVHMRHHLYTAIICKTAS